MKQNRTLNIGHSLQKGQIFGIDAMISFTIMLFCVLIFATTLTNYSQNTKQNLESMELEEKAMLVADSLVKNNDKNNSLLGACIIDTDKKRVLTNELDYKLLKNSKSIHFGEIFTKQIEITNKNGIEIIKLEYTNSTDCISVRRFALVDKTKSIISVVLCRNSK